MNHSPVEGIASSSQTGSLGDTLSYRIESWGCQMNVLDSQRMAGQLEGLGFRPAAQTQTGDVILLNTCAVREKAEAKVYSALGVLAERKRENQQLVIGVTGCVAQMEGDEVLERAPWVDFVAGPGEVERVGELVEAVRRERQRIKALRLPTDAPDYQFRQIHRDSAFSAYVTVIEGCDQFCTFCIVPFTRGRERSRRASEITREVAALTARGYTEITLLGQTVNAYRDPDENIGFGELLRRVSEVRGVRRLRFVTSHPVFVDDEMIRALARGGNIAPYLHLPAQSGSSRVLFRMKRRYDRDAYTETVARVRERIPEVAISSDFIVGFPGETDEDFEETLSLVRQVRFANIFAFCYSPREGTASARWGSAKAVPSGVSAERLSRLLALQEELQADSNRELVGREFEILVDGNDRRGQSRGRTGCNRIVHIEGAAYPTPPGTYVAVRIIRGLPNSLVGALAA
jgi:tRNA-2-methylthio-N6-dimethylallyladenosine synthase